VRASSSPATIPLGLLCVAAALRQDGHQVALWDRNVRHQPPDFKADIYGLTATTPMVGDAIDWAVSYPQRKFILGGHHATVCCDELYPDNVMLAIGECDHLDSRFYDFQGHYLGKPLLSLDDAPLPAYDLLRQASYCQPRIMVNGNPVAFMETSRGCYGRCSFCSHAMFGYGLRFKSPERVLEEIDLILSLGFGEIQLIDDNFTSDMDRAARICELIIKRGLKFPWCPRNGIRVDRVNLELLRLMRRAGCYKVFFGVESGSQRILDGIGKGISKEQTQKAVWLSKKVGLETGAYFMAGFPGEKEEELNDTMRFACKLNTDHVSLASVLPLPGTDLFRQMDRNGQIKTKDWSLYHFYTPPGIIYDHTQDIQAFVKRFYRRYYFRPRYILRKILTAGRSGKLWDYIKALVKIKWL